MTSFQRLAAAATTVAMLAGCATHAPYRDDPPVRAQPVPPVSQPVPRVPGYGYDRGYERGYDQGREWERAEFGRVEDIDLIRAESRTSGAGAVLGAVIGAVVGRQFGEGSGRDAGTAVGAVGGAIIGNQIEKQNRGARDMYRIQLRMQRGERRVIDVESPGDLRVGDRVRVLDNQIQRW